MPGLFLENHIYAHDGGENQLSGDVVSGDCVGNLERVVVGTGEQFLTDAAPLFGDMGELGRAGHKLEVPTGPFALQNADWLVVGIEDVKSAAEREEFLFESSDDLIVLVEDTDRREEDGDAPGDADQLPAVRRADLYIERGHPLVVGEAENFGQKT